MGKRGYLGIAIILAFLVLLFVAGFLVLTSKIDNTGKECSSDDECVPDSCCHASACTIKDKKPECNGIFCSEDCQPGTLDCGQGECKCLKNKCSAVLK